MQNWVKGMQNSGGPNFSGSIRSLRKNKLREVLMTYNGGGVKTRCGRIFLNSPFISCSMCVHSAQCIYVA